MSEGLSETSNLGEINKKTHNDNVADAIAAVVLIALVVTSAVFWVASQG